MAQPINLERLHELATFLKAVVDHGAVAPSWLPTAGSAVEDFMLGTCRGLRIGYWAGMPVPYRVVSANEIPAVAEETTAENRATGRSTD